MGMILQAFKHLAEPAWNPQMSFQGRRRREPGISIFRVQRPGM